MSIIKHKTNFFHLFTLIAVSIAIFLNFGCIERKFVIITNPADSEVYIDGKYVGNSVLRNKNDPNTGRIEIPFVYYAPREIIIKKKNYESRSEFLKPTTPWYDYFPVDFFTEILIPYTIKVRFLYRFDLDDYQDIDFESLIDKANNMRSYSAEKLDNSSEVAR